MMRKAGRYHALRAGIVAVVLVVATFTGLTIRDRVEEKQKANHATGLVQAVLNADIAQVPAIVGQMTDYRQWADPLLRDENSKAADKSRQKLHTSLALLPVDAAQVKYLKASLLHAEAGEVAVLRDALFPHKDQLIPELWTVVETPQKDKESQRLRAAAALAKYDAESEKWAKAQEAVDNDLVVVPAVYLSVWIEALRPVRAKLLPQLSVIYRNRAIRETERSLATDILADYAADDPPFLADLLMDAEDKQFAIIYPKFKEQGERSLPVLIGEINKKLPSDLPSSDEKREKLAKRQANAAVALLRMSSRLRQKAGEEPPTRVLANAATKVWPLLQHSPDPRLRSYLIHRLSPLGADAGAIVKRLDEEPDVTIRRAMLLSLGESTEHDLPAEVRKVLLPKLQTLYRSEADPGLHAAVEWLLRQWQEGPWLEQANDEWAKEKVKGEGWWVEGKTRTLHPSPAARHPPLPSGTSTVRGRRWW